MSNDSEGTAYRCFSGVGNISVNPDLRIKSSPVKAIVSWIQVKGNNKYISGKLVIVYKHTIISM